MLALALTGACAGSDTVELASTEQPVVANDVMNFHFDELPPAAGFDDRSPVNANGSCSGAACPGVGGTGLRGTPRMNNVKRAADFNGSSDCITIPDRTEHSLSLTNGLSFSVWVYPRSLPPIGGTSAFVSKYRTTNNQREWILGINNRDGSPRLGFWQSSLGTKATTTAVFSSRVLETSDLDRWIHVLLRIDSQGHYEWYVDGVESGSTASSGAVVNAAFKSGSSTTRIGCVDGTTASQDYFFHGKLDELMVVKSYMSSSEINKFYNWSRPIVPSMAHVAGSVWGSPVTAQEQIDVPELATRIQRLGMDVYRFSIRRNKNCQPACNDFAKLRELLAYFVANGISTKVIIEKNPFWYTIMPVGADQACFDAYDENVPQQHAKQWACAIAKLAAEYPDHLVGWSIDDFFVPRPSGNPEILSTFLNRQNAIAVCRELHDPQHHAPDLKLYATMYCEPVANAAPWFSYQDSPWWQGQTLSPNWTDAFVDYLTRPGGGVDVAELRECIDGVNLYTGPSAFGGAGPINACIDTLRELQVDAPYLEILEGVYVSEVSGGLVPPPTEFGRCDERKAYVDASRLTVPDGFIFYETVPTDDGCIHDYNDNDSSSEEADPVLGCQLDGNGPADDYGFCGMATKTRSPQTYIQY